MSTPRGLAVVLLLGCTSPRVGDDPAPAADASTMSGADAVPNGTGAPGDAPAREASVVPLSDDARAASDSGAAGPAPPPAISCPTGQTACAASPAPVCADLQLSIQHCGACGRGCLGGTCLFGVCQPSIVASGLTGQSFARGNPSFDGQRIFLLDAGGRNIQTIRLDSGFVQVFASTEGRASTVAVLDEHVYWDEADGSALRIVRRAKQGTAREVLVELAEPTSHVATGSLHLVGSHLYWLRRTESQHTVERTVPASGRVETVLRLTPAELSDDVVVHASGVYWRTGALPPREIWRSPLGGGARVMFDGGDAVHGLLAAHDGHLYWTGHNQETGQVNAVVRKALDGTRPRAVLGNTPFGTQGALPLFHDDTLFVFGTVDAGAMALPLSGGRPVEVAGTGRHWNPAGIGIDDRFVYWVTVTGVFWRVVR